MFYVTKRRFYMKSHKLRGVQKKEKQRWKELEEVINLS
jgi:hypothetical protein